MIFGHTFDFFAERGATATVREIAQQGDCWKKVPSLLADMPAAQIEAVAAALRNPQASIVFSGAGTSGYVGDIVAPAVSKFAAAHCVSRHSTDIVSNPALCVPRGNTGLLFAFARSGNSPESIDSLTKIDAVAPNIIPVSVTCNPEGALAKMAQTGVGISCLMPPETHDESFVMTSSFSTMTVFTAALCRRALGQDIEDMEALAAQSARINENFFNSSTCEAIANAERVIYLGSNGLWGAAREAALKILEMTAGAIPTMAETSLGFRHGPKSLVNNKTAVVVFASSDRYTQQYDRDMAMELAEDGKVQTLLVVGTAAFFARYPELVNHRNVVTETFDAALDNHDDVNLSVLHVNIGQLIGLKASLNLGISPDSPSPDGTVNRVVKGVTIHEYHQ